jgi:pimeloyl-ACP methyl ester carboxylesterase
VKQALDARERAGDDWLRDTLSRTGASRFVTGRGARIHYLVRGGDNIDKPALLLVHGFRGHAHWWDTVAPWFADGYRVITPDFSGMGDSDHRTSYGKDGVKFAQDLIEVVQRESPGPVVAVGHSYGGSRLLHACVLRPDLFSHAVILDTYVQFDGEALPAELTGPRRVYPEITQAIQRFRLLPDQPPLCPMLRDHLVRHSLREVKGGWTWKFDPDLPGIPDREGNVRQLLSRVTTPVDYAYGARSSLVDARRAKRITEALPNARGPFVIADGHHHTMLDQPVALINLLRTLLGGSE